MTTLEEVLNRPRLEPVRRSLADRQALNIMKPRVHVLDFSVHAPAKGPDFMNAYAALASMLNATDGEYNEQQLSKISMPRGGGIQSEPVVEFNSITGCLWNHNNELIHTVREQKITFYLTAAAIMATGIVISDDEKRISPEREYHRDDTPIDFFADSSMGGHVRTSLKDGFQEAVRSTFSDMAYIAQVSKAPKAYVECFFIDLQSGALVTTFSLYK